MLRFIKDCLKGRKLLQAEKTRYREIVFPNDQLKPNWPHSKEEDIARDIYIKSGIRTGYLKPIGIN